MRIYQSMPHLNCCLSASGPFTYDGIHEFLQALSYGRGSTEALRGTELPKVSNVDTWDGKDGKVGHTVNINLKIGL